MNTKTDEETNEISHQAINRVKCEKLYSHLSQEDKGRKETIVILFFDNDKTLITSANLSMCKSTQGPGW